MRSFLIDGFGSIGKQYGHIISSLVTSEDKVYIFDPYLQRSLADIFPSFVFLTTLDSIPDCIDFTIICSPTGTHVDKVVFYLSKSSKILVEKPLAVTAEEIAKCDLMLSRDPSLLNRVFVSSPRRFSCSFISLLTDSSHLASNATNGFFRFSHSIRRMRGINWRDNYVLDSNLFYPHPLVFDCIHELDISSVLFGPINSISILSAPSYLSSSVNLQYSLKAYHSNDKNYSFHYFDFLSDLKIREFSIHSPTGTFSSIELGKTTTSVITNICTDIHDGQSMMQQTTNTTLVDNTLKLQLLAFLADPIHIESFCSVTSALSTAKALISAS